MAFGARNRPCGGDFHQFQRRLVLEDLAKLEPLLVDQAGGVEWSRVPNAEEPSARRTMRKRGETRLQRPKPCKNHAKNREKRGQRASGR